MSSHIEHTQLNSSFGSSQSSVSHEFQAASQNSSDSNSRHAQANASQSSVNSVARTPFSCRFENTKYLVNVLSCLADGSRKMQHCQCEAQENGVMFIVHGKSKSSHIQAQLGSDLFSDYNCYNSVVFAVDLTMLLDCLNLFSGSDSSAVIMSLEAGSDLFRISLEDASGFMTMCEISVLYEHTTEDVIELATSFRSSPTVIDRLFPSEVLKDALTDLTELHGNNAVIKIEGSGDGPVVFSSESQQGRSSVCIGDPANDEEQHILYSFNYQGRLMDLVSRALTHAKESLIRINSNGILRAQHQIVDLNVASFVDDIILCDAEELEIV